MKASRCVTAAAGAGAANGTAFSGTAAVSNTNGAQSGNFKAINATLQYMGSTGNNAYTGTGVGVDVNITYDPGLFQTNVLDELYGIRSVTAIQRGTITKYAGISLEI